MTLINNEAVADETKLRLFSPYFYVPKHDKSGAQGLAYLYFGVEGKDPTLAINQKRVYAIQEDGSAIAISQPVRTGAGGTPEYNGSYVNLAIDGAYSLAVLDSNSAQVDYFSSIQNPTFSSAGITSIKEDIIQATASQIVFTFPNIDVSQASIDISSSSMVDPSLLDSRTLFKDIDYAVTDGGNGVITLLNVAFPSGAPEDALLRARQNVSTAQSNELSNIPRLYVQPDIATAITVNFSVGDTVKILSGSASNDGLTNDYEVVPESTGSADGINFITLSNNLQFRLIKTRNKLQAYTESQGTATILSGVITVDLNNGPVQSVTLTENISSFIFGNVSSEGSTTVQLKIKQDGTGSRSVSFTGFISAGGVAPSLSTGANEEDIFVFQTLDGGSAWYLFSSGSNMAVI